MFIFPQLVDSQKSRFNGTIKVYKQFNKYTISVDNLTQSGGLLFPIWKKALKKSLTNHNLCVSNCLILGLGAATSAKLINQFWPQAKIIGIEIDPQMIKLGKKYMKLNKIPNLKIVTANAFKQIYKYNASSFDLILVDTYHGKIYPPIAKTKKFFKQLKSLLTSKGIIIFNRLNWGQNQTDIQSQIASLKSIFPNVTSQQILSNTLIYCPYA